MNKIKYYVILAAVGFLFLSGCSPSDKKEAEETERKNEKVEEIPEENLKLENQVSYTGKVIENRETSLLIASDATEGLLDVNFSFAKLIKKGEAVTAEDITPGTVVEVSFDGSILESYPGQIFASQIEVKSREDDLVSLYVGILKEVYENDEGLNGNISIIAVDLSKADNLTKGEKEAVLYQAWVEFGMKVTGGTYEELKEWGYLSEDGMSFPDGVLLTIEVLEEGTDSFRFSAQKWRSGLGADFYTDCMAEKKDGKYGFKLGGYSVS